MFIILLVIIIGAVILLIAVNFVLSIFRRIRRGGYDDDYDDNNVFEKEYKNQRVIHRFDLNDEMDKPVLKCPGLNCSNCNRTKCLNEK